MYYRISKIERIWHRIEYERNLHCSSRFFTARNCSSLHDCRLFTGRCRWVASYQFISRSLLDTGMWDYKSTSSSSCYFELFTVWMDTVCLDWSLQKREFSIYFSLFTILGLLTTTLKLRKMLAEVTSIEFGIRAEFDPVSIRKYRITRNLSIFMLNSILITYYLLFTIPYVDFPYWWFRSLSQIKLTLSDFCRRLSLLYQISVAD
jgi:hypothetical protein